MWCGGSGEGKVGWLGWDVFFKSLVGGEAFLFLFAFLKWGGGLGRLGLNK